MAIWALDDAEPDIHPDAFVHPAATVIGAVTIGADASIWPGVVVRADFSMIHIGARTSVQDGTIIHTTREWPTQIGSDCLVGHGAHLEGCVVEDWSLIGSGSIVLNRARIGRGALIAAGALVPEDMEIGAGESAVGVPAKIRDVRLPDGWMERAVQVYVDNGRRHRREMRRIDRG